MVEANKYQGITAEWTATIIKEAFSIGRTDMPYLTCALAGIINRLSQTDRSLLARLIVQLSAERDKKLLTIQKRLKQDGNDESPTTTAGTPRE